MFCRTCALILVFAVFAPARTPITHENMWMMKRVGAPTVSPDGRWVVFSVQNPSYDEKLQTSDLWVVPADGSAPPRQITYTKTPESGVTWSPDSRKIAFSAKRDGDDAEQIYILDLAEGGEAARVTALTLGATHPHFSPDGTRIAFQSPAYPGARNEADNKRINTERKAVKYHARVFDTFPVRYWDHWLEEPQAHVMVQTIGASEPRDLLAGSELVAEAGFSAPNTMTGQNLEITWTPDGNSVLFTASTNHNQAAYAAVEEQIYQVAITGGEPHRVTPGTDSYSHPEFRPDGKALYALQQRENGKVYSLHRLTTFAWPNPSERTWIAPKFDRSVSGYAISPDGRTIYLTAEDAGHEKLFSVPATGGDVNTVVDLKDGTFSNLTMSKSGAAIAVVNWESTNHPQEVVRVNLDKHTQQQLTKFNDRELADLDLPPVREFWFTSSKGKRIHNQIVVPQDFDEHKKYPLVVMMHGGPANMNRDSFGYRWNPNLIAQPGYIILMTDYTGSTGYGEKFAQDIQGDPLKGPGEEINEAADYAIAHFRYIDGSRQCAIGASYGGHLANWMQASTTRYRCLVSHAGLVNLESQWGTSDAIYHREVGAGGPVWEQGPIWKEQNPIRYAAKFRTPILLTVGERDFRVPMNNTLENWAVLQRLKIPSRLIVFPNANHWITNAEDSRFFYGELAKWLAHYLKPETASAD